MPGVLVIERDLRQSILDMKRRVHPADVSPRSRTSNHRSTGYAHASGLV